MVAVLLAILLQTPAQASPPVELPVSVERIRAGLARRPSPFEPALARPFRGIFRVKIEAWDAFPDKPWERDLPVPPWVRPLAPPAQFEFLGSVTPEEFRASTLYPCCDVLPVIGAVGKAIGGAVRSAKERRAKREVEEAMRAAGIRPPR